MKKHSRNRSFILFSHILICTLFISCSPAPEVLPETSTSSPDISSDSASEPDSSIAKNIRAYMGRFAKDGASSVTDEDFIAAGVNIKTKLLMDMSAEGGEITRYEDGKGQILKYRLRFYGETGRVEHNYYLIDDFVYYTELLEEYRTPINVEGADTDVLRYTMTEGILIDGVCYRYDHKQDQILKTDILSDVYTPEELEKLYEEAGNSGL